MTSPQFDHPYRGGFVGSEHRFALTIYFEDTDTAGPPLLTTKVRIGVLVEEPRDRLAPQRRDLGDGPLGDLDERVGETQHRLDPLWARISCHLDNPVDRMLREAGFDVIELRSGYLGKGPKPMTFMYEGRARRAAGADPWPSGTPNAGSSDPGAAP